MEQQPSEAVDPIAFTKERVAQIGEVWKSYALTKKSEAISRVEDQLDKAPAQLKKWLKLPTKGGEASDAQPPANGSMPSMDAQA